MHWIEIRCRIPQEVSSNNGPQFFCLQEFWRLCKGMLLSSTAFSPSGNRPKFNSQVTTGGNL